MQGDFRLSDWLVQPSLGRMEKDGQTVHVRAKVMDLLVYLAARPGEVVSKDALLDGVWNTDAISESALTRTITELRQALGDSVEDPKILVTIPKRGYRLVAPVATATASTPTADATARRRRSLRRPFLLAGALAVLAIGVWWIGRSIGRVDRAISSTDGAPVDPGNRVAVMPFTYRGAHTHAYLAESMVDLLSRTLDGAGPLRTVDPRAVLGVLAQQPAKQDGGGASSANSSVDTTVATTVAKALGVGQYVSGDIVEAGGTLRITARLVRVGAGDPVSAGVEGPPDALFALVDDLTRQLAVGGGAGPRLSSTAARTTPSLEALKEFLQGERFFRDSTGAPQGLAYKAFDRAVQLDPTFAIGWYRLSQTAYFSGNALNQVPEFAESAARRSGGLPWRERRLIEANWAYARGAARESRQTYQEILRTYPDDVEALFGLALLGAEYTWLLGGSSIDHRKPIGAFLQYVPDHRVALEILRNAEVRNRNCAAARTVNQRMFPTVISPMSRAVVAFCGPPSEEQEALLRSPREWPEAIRVARFRLEIISQNPHAAAVIARAIIVRDESVRVLPQRQADLLSLAELELAQGHRKAADDAFARLALVNPHWALADTTYRMLAAHHSTTVEQLRTAQEWLKQWAAEAVPPIIEDGLRLHRHNGLHGHLRAYLLGRISARLGANDEARRFADELDRMGSPKAPDP